LEPLNTLDPAAVVVIVKPSNHPSSLLHELLRAFVSANGRNDTAQKGPSRDAQMDVLGDLRLFDYVEGRGSFETRKRSCIKV
jgi:hypothetical protein